MKKPHPKIITMFSLILFMILVQNSILSLGKGKWKEPSFSQSKTLSAMDSQSIIVCFKDEKILLKKGMSRQLGLRDVLEKVHGKEGILKDKKGKRLRHIKSGRINLIELEGMKVEDAVKALKNHPAIEYAEPNYTFHITRTPKDVLFNQLWGLHNTTQLGGFRDADVDAPEAWDIIEGNEEIVVGVIDTGIDYTHEDLAANMWVNPMEIPGNAIDDDGNGYIDDIHGANFIYGTGDPMDDHDHGTHCAGTIGAVGNNGIGVTGVNWKVKLIGLKFLTKAGSGYVADAIEAINYAIELKNRGVNLRVLSNSWGGVQYSQSLADAIEAARDAGILFVAAAGNSALDTDRDSHYPSSYAIDNVISIAATDKYDELAYFSNYGPASVHLGAPGVEILSTTIGNTYSFFNGTSMATPHVSGVAALLLGYNDSLSIAELKQLLMDNGDSIPALEGKTISGKRLNAMESLSQAPPPGPGFRISLDESILTMIQGDQVQLLINTEALVGYDGMIELNVTTETDCNAVLTIAQPNLQAGSSTTLDIITDENTSAEKHIITVTATDGTIVRSKSIVVTVRPFGWQTISFTNQEQQTINTDQILISNLDIPDSLDIFEATVSIDLFHPCSESLHISIVSPEGVSSTLQQLRDTCGSQLSGFQKTFALPDFTGESTKGIWQLKIDSPRTSETGILHNWSLNVAGLVNETINIEPAADFDFTVEQLEENYYAVSFVSNSEDPDGFLSKWEWNFGNRRTSYEENPVHRYYLSTYDIGIYEVSLVVTDNRWKKSVPMVRTVHLGDQYLPVAKFNIEIDIVTDDKMVFFYDFSVDMNGYIKDWEWDFGDGQTSPEQNPAHRYESYGEYTISLVAIDNENNRSQAYTKVILVQPNSIPVANFSYQPDLPYSSRNVHFTSLATDADGYLETWHWDFGDGTTSDEKNPTHLYLSHGSYPVSLTVMDNHNGVSEAFDHTIVLEPVASRVYEDLTPENIPDCSSFWLIKTFDITDNFIIKNAVMTLNVTHPYFYDLVGQLIAPSGTSTSFDFSSHTSGKTTEHDIRQFLGENGSGTWTLKILDRYCGNSGKLNNWSLIFSGQDTSQNTLPAADFSYISEELTVHFSETGATPNGSIIHWEWDFGDGQTSVEQNPVHTYQSRGEFHATLVVTDSAGWKSPAVTQTIIFNRNFPPRAAFNASVNDLTVSLTNTSTDADGGIISWYWDFGDGTTSGDVNPSYTYSSYGSFTISLVVTDNEGATSEEAYKTIQFSPISTHEYVNNQSSTIKYGWTTSYIRISDAYIIQQAVLNLNITHSRMTDLRAILTAPSGKKYTIYSFSGYASGSTISFPMPALSGDPSNGLWKLQIYDKYSAYNGTLKYWSVSLTTTDGDVTIP